MTGSNDTSRPVSPKECERMTPVASANRHAFSALLRGSNPPRVHAPFIAALATDRRDCRRQPTLGFARTSRDRSAQRTK